MFIAIDERNGKRISADDAIFVDSAFFCPCCYENLVLKKGFVKATHFAHQSRKHCDSFYDSSNVMSEWHRNWQECFPKENREIAFIRGEERHIADIFSKNYVIEFQHSPISAGIFLQRTKFYIKCCKKVIWLFDFREECACREDINGNNWRKCYEYEKNKWAWKNPKRTFDKVQINFEYYKKHICLFFQDELDHIRKIVWNIHRWDDTKRDYINSYTRFCTKGDWSPSEFLKSIQCGLF